MGISISLPRILHLCLEFRISASNSASLPFCLSASASLPRIPHLCLEFCISASNSASLPLCLSASLHLCTSASLHLCVCVSKILQYLNCIFNIWLHWFFNT